MGVAMATELLTSIPCRTCAKRKHMEVKCRVEILKTRVVVHVELYCSHCGALRAEAVLALSEGEFSWH